MGKHPLQVGQRVILKSCTHDMQGVVKEDRGPIGMKGRVLYRIEFRFDAESPPLSHIELPADRLKKVERTIMRRWISKPPTGRSRNYAKASGSGPQGSAAFVPRATPSTAYQEADLPISPQKVTTRRDTRLIMM